MKEVLKIDEAFFRVSSVNYKIERLIAIILCAFFVRARYYFMHYLSFHVVFFHTLLVYT
jgi:hypothetical protein